MQNMAVEVGPESESVSEPGSGASSEVGAHAGVATRMRAVTARDYGTSEVVTVEELPVPAPESDQVLVEVAASSLNALDWHFLTGTPYFVRLIGGLRKPKRITPGSDVAGTVVSVGPDVTRFKPGDEVFGEISGGGCAGYTLAKEGGLVIKPADVSFEAAGAIPVAGLTALQGLRTHGQVQSGEQVLINGAAGGVGPFAVQIAKALGAEVTAVCSGRNAEMVRGLGADLVIDYTKDDFTAMSHRFDVMLDGVGNHSASAVLGVLKPEARYLAISGPKANPWLDPLPYMFKTGIRFRRASQSFKQFTAKPDVDDLTFLGELVSSGQVTPEIQRVIGLDGVADGLAEIGTGHARAKIVVVPNR